MQITLRRMRFLPCVLLVLTLSACASAAPPVPSAAPTRLALPTEIPPAQTPSPTPMLPPASTSTPIMPTTPTGSPPFKISWIDMIDADNGWATGGVGEAWPSRIYRTSDGGRTWRDVSPMPPEWFSGAVFFLDSGAAWAGSLNGGDAWRTDDGGQGWTPIADFESLLGRWTEIWFNDSQRGWRMDYRTDYGFGIKSFATTQDGGETWQETNRPSGPGIARVAYLDPQTAWVIHADSWSFDEERQTLTLPFFVSRTTDGGQTWTSREIPLPPDTDTFTYTVDGSPIGTVLDGVGHCGVSSPVYSSKAMWKLALRCEARSWMYTSANRGQTWIISEMPAGVDTDTEFVNQTIGWLFVRDSVDPTQGQLYRTGDGGWSWSLLKNVGWADVQLDFIDAQTGWAVASACPEDGCDSYPYISQLIKTTDGGQTWQAIEPQLVQ